MPHANRRADRVAEGIREQVAGFLADGVKDPRVVGLVAVTAVEVTQDLRHAKVFVSVLGTEEERKATFEGLASLASHLRSRVARVLRLRFAPELEFRHDASVERASRIESLLAQLKDGRVPADDEPLD